MAFCSNCGSELKPNERFCGNCGTAVEGAAQTSQSPQPTGYSPQGQPQNYPAQGQPGQQPPNYQYQQPQQGFQGYQAQPTGYGPQGQGVEDTANPILFLCAFCVPLVGAILWAVWREERPQTAKTMGILAIVGFAVSFLSGFVSG